MTIHFACSHCGQCCRSAERNHLAVTLEEWPALAGRMLFEGRIHLHARQPGAEPALAAHVDSFTHGLDLPVFPYHLRLQAELVTVPRPDGSCWQLEGERCAIYDERPFACRLYPFLTSYPASHAEAALRFHDGCRTGAEEPPLVEGGQVAEPGYAGSWAQMEDLCARRKRLSAFIAGHPLFEADRAAMIRAALAGGSVSVDVGMFVDAALSFGVLAAAGVPALLEAQIGLAEQRLRLCRDARIKTQRQVNAELQAHAAVYRNRLARGRTSS